MVNKNSFSNFKKLMTKDTIAAIIFTILFAAIIGILIAASLDAQEFKFLKIHAKFFLPIFFIIETVCVAFLIVKSFKEQFNKWLGWNALEKSQGQLISTDGAIIAGLFILLAIVFQSQEAITGELRSRIISITPPTVFPFVASIMLLTFFGFAPDYWPNPVTKLYEKVPQWPAKMGILLMVFGFVWIMGDLVLILFLLAYQ